MNNRIIVSGLIAALLAVAGCATTGQTGPGKPEYMVVGIDNKVTWGDDGKVQNLAPGKDAVTIVDIGTDPANPKIVAASALTTGPSSSTGHSPLPTRGRIDLRQEAAGIP